MATASSTANPRSSRSSNRTTACHRLRSAVVTTTSVATIARTAARPDSGGQRLITIRATTALPRLSGPSALAPREIGQPGGEAGERVEHEPALDAMDIAHDALELIGKEKRDAEADRHADDRCRGVDEHELPERQPTDARGEKGGRPDAHDVPRNEHDLGAVLTVPRLERLLALGGQHAPNDLPLEHPLAPVMADRVEGDVAAQHAEDAHRQRDPPVHNVFVGKDTAGDDRDLLRNRQTEAGREQREEESGVGEVLDEPLDHGLY